MTVTLAEIRSTPLSIDEVVASVSDRRAGGICVFIGTVRDHDAPQGTDSQGAPEVVTLDYSAHPQAADVARELAERLAADGRAVKIGVVHRVGSLGIGDLAVVAAVSAEHRAEAFEVCRMLIDEFKATVPVWKHQQFADGSDNWVGLP